MNKTNKVAQMPPSITLRLSRGRSVKITWQPRKRVSSLLVKLLTKALAIFLPLSMSAAHALDVNALPTGGQVTAGSATINQAGNTLNINQASQKAALNWQNFNIGTNSTVNFVQPNSNAVALNRIGGNSASEIYGHLNANGQVFMMNPNGILFARGSQVNVGGIVATTMQLGDADFLAGNYNFNNAGAGSVANYGLINATNSVALLGSDVSNQGSIFATTASLVSGNTVALDVSTDGLIRARVVDVAMQANIANSGDINATQVTLSAGQAKDTLNRVVNNSGVIKATGFSSMNGEIVLQGGTTLNSGTLDAASATGNGGTVHMLGQHVGVIDSGSIDVSGATGGGTILVGGDYQGKNISIENAEVTYVGAQATLRADATQNGNGGKVIVWADDTTRAYGSISAQGGALGGDGGFVETSGHRYLDVNGVYVDTRALQGVTGNWLLDPRDLTILGGVGTGTNYAVSGSTIFTAANNASSSIYAGTINTALTSNSVTINTGTGNSGDIVFDSTSGAILISTAGSTASRTLTLNALGNIVFTGSSASPNTSFQSSLDSTNPIALNVALNAAGLIRTDSNAAVTLDGTVGSAGTVTFTVPAGITWDNHGILNINGKATVHLAGGTPASFINHSGGTVNAASTTGFAFYSSPSDDGIISNDGIFNVTASTALEAAFNQTATGTLNVKDVSFNLQNAKTIAGSIDLRPAGATFAATLNVNELHGSQALFTGTQFANTNGGGGTLYVAGSVGIPSADFSGVTAPGIQLNIGGVGSGNVSIIGDSIFYGVGIGSGGALDITNAKLGITGGAFTVPTGVTYHGNVGYYAAGDLHVDNSISVLTSGSSSSVTLMAGWNPTTSLSSAGFSGPGNLSIAGTANIIAKDILLDARNGSIIQSSGAGVISSIGTLTANAANGIDLDGSLNNQVNTFVANNTSSGDIDFFNANNGDSLAGPVVDFYLGNVTNGATGGYVDVESHGAILQSGNINTNGGDITVIANYDINMNPGVATSAAIANSTSSNFIYYESTYGNLNLGLLDAGAGTVDITAGLNILDGNGTANNIKASYASLIASDLDDGPGKIDVDTQVSALDIDNNLVYSTVGQTLNPVSIRNTGSNLLVNATSDWATEQLTISNDHSITVDNINGVSGATNITLQANGATSDILFASGGYINAHGSVTLTAGRDITLTNGYIDALTGMTVSAGRDINIGSSANNIGFARVYTADGNQIIAAGRNISLAGGAPSTGPGIYAEIKHAGSGNQIIDFINGGILTLTGGTGTSTSFGSRARIENASLASSNSVQKIWSSAGSTKYPAIVMNGGSSGGLDSISSNDLSNSAEIGSDYGQQFIYASTIDMAGRGGAAGYAGAIISAPNQQITTTGNVTLTGGASNSTTAGAGDQFTYNSVTYNLASPAAIGDKNTLIQTLDIGGALTLNGGSGTSGLAMVGSLHGIATGSIKANSVALNSSGSLAFLGGVEDVIVTNTFVNSGGALTDNSAGSNPWSIWALNPTKITGCGAGTGCLANFAQYGATFSANPTILGSGHGLMYSVAAPTLASTMTGAVSKAYDGNTSISLTGATFTVSGAVYGDDISLASINGGTGSLSDPNVGSGKQVTATGMTASGVKSSSATGGISVYGYLVAAASANIGTVETSTLSVSDDVNDVITVISGTSDYKTSSDDGAESKSEDITGTEKVLLALNSVDDPKDNKENPVETEQPKGRTLQCSVKK